MARALLLIDIQRDYFPGVDPATRVYGDTAITIGRHVQRAEYRSRPAHGEFRSTQIAVCAASDGFSPVFTSARAAASRRSQLESPTRTLMDERREGR